MLLESASLPMFHPSKQWLGERKAGESLLLKTLFHFDTFSLFSLGFSLALPHFSSHNLIGWPSYMLIVDSSLSGFRNLARILIEITSRYFVICTGWIYKAYIKIVISTQGFILKFRCAAGVVGKSLILPFSTFSSKCTSMPGRVISSSQQFWCFFFLLTGW